MPSIVCAPIKITGAEGNITFGDVLQITPKYASKTYSGAAVGLTGDFARAFSVISFTNTIDRDAIDTNNTKNN